MCNANITVERASSSRDEQGEHAYRIMSGHVELRRVYAPDARCAERLWYSREIDGLRAIIDQRTPTADIVIVGEAIRNGGYTEIGMESAHGYIEAARVMGFAARTHTTGDSRYLMVAIDDRALNKLKRRLDAATANRAN